MSVADAEPTSGGGGGGWSYGDQISASMRRTGRTARTFRRRRRRSRPSGGARSPPAGCARARKRPPSCEVSPSARTRLSPRPSRTPTADRTRRSSRRTPPDAASARRERGSTDDPFPTKDASRATDSPGLSTRRVSSPNDRVHHPVVPSRLRPRVRTTPLCASAPPRRPPGGDHALRPPPPRRVLGGDGPQRRRLFPLRPSPQIVIAATSRRNGRIAIPCTAVAMSDPEYPSVFVVASGVDDLHLWARRRASPAARASSGFAPPPSVTARTRASPVDATSPDRVPTAGSSPRGGTRVRRPRSR